MTGFMVSLTNSANFTYEESKHFWEEIDDDNFFGFYRVVSQNQQRVNTCGVFLYVRKYFDDDYVDTAEFVSGVFAFY